MTDSIVYLREGQVERPTGKGTRSSPLSYRWCVGYLRIGHREGGGIQRLWPGLTRRECIQEAHNEQRKLVFVRTAEEAEAALKRT
jgi:hypothetical protein